MLQVLLESITAAPNAPLEELVIMDRHECQLVLHTFNETGMSVTAESACGSATIHGMLQYWTQATPNAPSVVFEVSLGLLLSHLF